MNNTPRIVFMGTPEFAMSSLQALMDAEYNIVAVITAPDKPAGRGLKLSVSAVKKYAIEKNIEVLQPVKLKDPAFLSSLKALEPDLQIVVAFRMLPEVVWNLPPMGTINVHASLLPKYRGAAPINWAIINGETETGVTTFKLTHEIDTGNILLQKKISIEENDNAGDIHDKLKEEGASLLLKTVQGLLNHSIVEKPQENIDASSTHAPKIFTETCRINWTLPAKKVNDLIRGLSPFPGAFTTLDGKTVKLYKASVHDPSNSVVPGTYETDGKTFLRFAAADRFIDVHDIQEEGKKRMFISEYLRGKRF